MAKFSAVVACSTFCVLASFSLFIPTSLSAQSGNQVRRPKVVALDAGDRDYLAVLSGPPETVSMKSGLVALNPGQSVGKHSTGSHEELLVVLAGKGVMLFKDGSSIAVEENHAVYCPPLTEHDVKNTGTSPLRYVYVVADAK